MKVRGRAVAAETPGTQNASRAALRLEPCRLFTGHRFEPADMRRDPAAFPTDSICSARACGIAAVGADLISLAVY